MQLLLIIIIILIMCYFYRYSIEGYESIITDNNFMKGSAISSWDLLDNSNGEDCYGKKCAKVCNNDCGICNEKGIRTCLPGDINGPYFKLGCDTWTYQGQTVLPFDTMLPGYKYMPLNSYAPL